MSTSTTRKIDTDFLWGKLRSAVQWGIDVAPIGIVFLLWELASGTIVPVAILPPFSATWPQIVQLWVSDSSKLHPYMLATLYRWVIAILISTGLGLTIGLAMARNEFIRRQIDPVISITYPSPKAPLIPLVIFWLGIGHVSRIFLGVISSFLPIVISTINGADNIDKELLWSARSMGVSRFEETVKIVLPAALPTILTGIRIGLIFAFVTILSSEMIIARTGLGVLIVQFGAFGQYARVFAVVFYIVLIVAGFDRIYVRLSNYLLRWSEQEVGGI